MKMKTLFWKIWYLRPHDVYYWFKNRFFKRYDLIRTGLSKSSWADKDYLMLYGMMGLLVDFVEKERGIYYVDDAPEQNETKRKLMDLYTEWIVDYPNLVRLEEESLTAWCNTTNMEFRDCEMEEYSEIVFVQEEGFTKADSTKLFDLHSKAELKREEKEQDMLKRLVELRQYLWT